MPARPSPQSQPGPHLSIAYLKTASQSLPPPEPLLPQLPPFPLGMEIIENSKMQPWPRRRPCSAHAHSAPMQSLGSPRPGSNTQSQRSPYSTYDVTYLTHLTNLTFFSLFTEKGYRTGRVLPTRTKIPAPCATNSSPTATYLSTASSLPVQSTSSSASATRRASVMGLRARL